MSIFSFIAGIFTPAAKLIDDLVTSDEERLQLRNEFAVIQEKVNSKVIELEKARLDAMAKVEVSEASSMHWLRGNWRPIVSLTLVLLIVLHSFKAVELGPQVYDLAEIFLGGYVGSRGLEKIAGKLKGGI